MADPNPDRSPGIRRQMEIYKAGAAGEDARPAGVRRGPRGSGEGETGTGSLRLLGRGRGGRTQSVPISRHCDAGGSCPARSRTWHAVISLSKSSA